MPLLSGFSLTTIASSEEDVSSVMSSAGIGSFEGAFFLRFALFVGLASRALLLPLSVAALIQLRLVTRGVKQKIKQSQAQETLASMCYQVQDDSYF
jgi:hypothetical protein